MNEECRDLDSIPSLDDLELTIMAVSPRGFAFTVATKWKSCILGLPYETVAYLSAGGTFPAVKASY